LAFGGVRNPAVEFGEKPAAMKMLARFGDSVGSGSGRRDKRICLAKTGWNATISGEQVRRPTGRIPGRNTMKTILRASFICVLFAGSAAALTGERMATIPLEKMTPAQRNVADAIMTGPRKSIGGPFNAWLRSPELADRLQKVGEYLRFDTSLDKRVNEMAIIMTAQAWGSQYEWHAHAPLAIKAGLDPAIVAAIGAGRKPDNMKDDEAIVWEFSTQLRRDHGVDDTIYARALEKFGEAGIMDLVAVNGYYDVVSMTLNVARVPAPAGEELPFKQAGR
jgi:4-carboxymuconolactone decarboxylase